MTFGPSREIVRQVARKVMSKLQRPGRAIPLLDPELAAVPEEALVGCRWSPGHQVPALHRFIWRATLDRMADTGFPAADAEHDFLRARRRQVLSQLAARLRREPQDVSELLPFDEVVAALGCTGEHKLGLQVITLDSIVGSVDRTRDFDRWFRPRSDRSRERWERLARAQRRGEAIPPIDVYRMGELHFVQDGHHRVSVAHALGLRSIDAYVTEVNTKIDSAGALRSGVIKDLRAERPVRR